MKSVTIVFIQALLSFVQPEMCPKNLVEEAQTCFSALARAVHSKSGPDAKMPDAGPGMTLDYTQIKKYCAKNGHMSKFVDCIETLVSLCENSPQAKTLDRLVSPRRVKQAVPTLCTHQDEVEGASVCMNSAMTIESSCKAQSFARIKEKMALSSRNATAMFLNQCLFFHSLAECQRKTVLDKCGSKFGDIHADFLLSFVPTSCIDGLQGVTSSTLLIASNLTSSNPTNESTHETVTSGIQVKMKDFDAVRNSNYSVSPDDMQYTVATMATNTTTKSGSPNSSVSPKLTDPFFFLVFLVVFECLTNA